MIAHYNISFPNLTSLKEKSFSGIQRNDLSILIFTSFSNLRLKKVQERNKKLKAIEEDRKKKLIQEGFLKEEPAVKSLVDNDKDEDLLF